MGEIKVELSRMSWLPKDTPFTYYIAELQYMSIEREAVDMEMKISILLLSYMRAFRHFGKIPPTPYSLGFSKTALCTRQLVYKDV